jgi:hypothetical protein
MFKASFPLAAKKTLTWGLSGPSIPRFAGVDAKAHVHVVSALVGVKRRRRRRCRTVVHLRRRSSAEARFRRADRALNHCMEDVRHAQRGEVECVSGVPCVDRRSVCGRLASGDGQARMVGVDGGAGPSHRHEPLLRDLRERDRRVHGLDRTARCEPCDGAAVRFDVSGDHHSRHGARASDAARSSGDRDFVLRCRRIDGRDAGAAMGGELSRSRVLGVAAGDGRAAFGAEHCVPRSRPAGDHGRSRVERRRLHRQGHEPA